MSISNSYEAILLAALSNGDWKQWWRGDGSDGGLHPELLTNSFFETDASSWTLSNEGGTYTPSWDGNTTSWSQGWVKFKSNWGSVSQTVTGLTVGETYAVNARLTMFSIGTTDIYIEIIDGSNSYESEHMTNYTADYGSGDNNVVGIVFEPQNTSVTVKIWGKASASNPYVKQVSLRKSDRWLGLHTQEPLDPANGTYGEVSGNGYARIPITFGISDIWKGIDDTNMYNSAALEFPEATASWGTITHLAVYSVAERVSYSGGSAESVDNEPENDHLFSIALDASKTIDAGDIVRFERASIELDATNS